MVEKQKLEVSLLKVSERAKKRRRTGFVQEFFDTIGSSNCDTNIGLLQVFRMFIQFEVL
jgi:hypothetical protein